MLSAVDGVDGDGRSGQGFRHTDAEHRAFGPDLRREGIGRSDRFVGYGRRVLDDAVDEDFYVAAHVFNEVGAVGGAGHERFAAAGRYDGLRFAIGRVEREVEAEGVPRIYFVLAGAGVGGGAFYLWEVDGVVDRGGWWWWRLLVIEGGAQP